MVKKMNPLPYNPFLQNFKILKFLYDLVFHQIHLMNMFLLYKFFDINCMTYAFLLILFKKLQFKHLITLVYKTQNDIYIVSKSFY
jgi:hypothetical protein